MIRKTRWGEDEVIYETDDLKVKVLTIEPGKGTSLQKHKHRAEEWLILDGAASIRSSGTNGGKMFIWGPYDPSVCIMDGDLHQLWNHGDIPLRILEVWRAVDEPPVLSEDDIERVRYTWDP